MQVAARIDQAKYDVFRWRYELSLPMKLALALGFAGLIGLIAQLRFGWPVPITGQTFAVLLAGVLMGRWWGGVSMAIYVGLGVACSLVSWLGQWSGPFTGSHRWLPYRFCVCSPFPGLFHRQVRQVPELS